MLSNFPIPSEAKHYKRLVFRINENVRGRYMKTFKQFQKGNSGEPLDEGMTSNVAKMIAIGLKKRCISLGNQVESVTDVGEKINNLSKQLNAVAGIALVAVSMSDEGLLSKGMILTSLLSSHEPDENLDTLFEDLC